MHKPLAAFVPTDVTQVTADWQFFSAVFSAKQPHLFEYHARVVLEPTLRTQRWCEAEDSLLIQLVTQGQPVKWHEVAKELFAESGRTFTRTPKQCRERWLNHLDPRKSKETWSLEECRVLFEVVREQGKKWAYLVRVMEGKRSEHSIKNKYNSMMARQCKLTPELNEDQLSREIVGKIVRKIGQGREVDEAGVFSDHGGDHADLGGLKEASSNRKWRALDDVRSDKDMAESFEGVTSTETHFPTIDFHWVQT
jgi:hypothetical protein